MKKQYKKPMSFTDSAQERSQQRFSRVRDNWRIVTLAFMNQYVTSPTHSQGSMCRGIYVTNISETFSLKYFFCT